jgi:hypothetical protein
LTTAEHSAEEGAILATEVASVQQERIVEPVRSTDEVRPSIEGEEPVVETVNALMLEATKAVQDIVQG